MTNQYYNPTQTAIPGTTVRSAQFNNNNDEIIAGFGLLPAPINLFSGNQNFGPDTGLIENVYEVSIRDDVITAYTDGLTIQVRASKSNTGASRVNLNGLGLRQIRNQNNESVVINDILINRTMVLRYNASTTFFMLDTIDPEASGPFTYRYIGNISIYVGDTITEATSNNAYQFPDNSGEWYGPVQGQSFPITVPADPESDSGWVNVNAATEAWVRDNVANENLIFNAGFEVPGTVTNPPDATPRAYVANDEIFSGYFAVDALSGVTYVNGLLNGAGQVYTDVIKSRNQLNSTVQVSASIAGSNGLAKQGATVVDNGTSWRVTFDMNDTFSVKLEEGSSSTRHEALDSTFTLNGKFTYQSDSVENMVEGISSNGSVYLSNVQQWFVGATAYKCNTNTTPAPNGISDFTNLTETEPTNVAQNAAISRNTSVVRSLATSKINANKGVSVWSMQAPICNLGDSISHGAFAGDLYYNGWTRILSRMFGCDFGGLTYQGFVPMITLGSGTPNESRDIHAISFVGSWVGQNSSNTVNGAASYNGLSFQSTTLNDRITSVIPTFQSNAIVWYLQQPGGGELTISDNTGVQSVVNTDGALSVRSLFVALTDNGQGSASLIAQKTDANSNPVDVMGFGYVEGSTTPVIHNFADSGRRLRYVDEQVINDCANNASIFMLSLGHNDQGDVDSDPSGAYAVAFTQRINWIIQYCNTNNTFLLVNDFCWTAADTSFTRLELQRAASETNGLYIPFPNLIRPDGVVPDSDYLINTINMWADGSHPNSSGNKWIAEIIAKNLSLSCSSKKDAIASHDFWMPFDLPVGTENSFTAPTSVSSYRINGEELNFRYSVQRAAGGSFPTGNYQLQTGWRVTPPFLALGTGLALLGVIRQDTNAITSSVVVGQTGSVTLNVTDGTWINDQSGICKLPIKIT